MSTNFEMLVLQARTTLLAFSPGDYTGDFKKENDIWGEDYSFYQSGAHSAYRQLNSQWGFKVFKNRKQRDGSHAAHLLLERDEIGPKMGPKFQSKTHRGAVVYGYICEHIHESFRNINMNAVREKRHELWNKRNNFVDHVRNLGHYISDLHDNNIRVRKDGTLLVSDVSFQCVRRGKIDLLDCVYIECVLNGTYRKVGA